MTVAFYRDEIGVGPALLLAIVVTLSRQLSWSHFSPLLPLSQPLQREFYAEMARSCVAVPPTNLTFWRLRASGIFRQTVTYKGRLR